MLQLPDSARTAIKMGLAAQSVRLSCSRDQLTKISSLRLALNLAASQLWLTVRLQEQWGHRPPSSCMVNSFRHKSRLSARHRPCHQEMVANWTTRQVEALLVAFHRLTATELEETTLLAQAPYLALLVVAS